MKIGDVIRFGNYDWIVVDLETDKAFLLSKEILFQQIFHLSYCDITWEHCSLRKYLNTTFYDSFDEVDKARIVKTLVVNEDNQWYGTNGGNDTRDFIYLPSIKEITSNFFGDSSKLLFSKGKNQRYWFERKDVNNAKRISIFKCCKWWYWLRSPGRMAKSAAYVHGDGNIGMQGNNVSRNNYNTIHSVTRSNVGGIRPVLWINLRRKNDE